jgi:sugar phosphate isomerase/epimerase
MNWIMHIHLKDQVGFKGSFDFPALGDGEVHFHEIFRILAKHKWRGTMSAEIEYEGIKGRKAPKRHADVIDNDAQKSCEFIAKMIGRYLGDAKIA